MTSSENRPPSAASNALSLGPRQRSSKSHHLTAFGRHVGRTVWTFCTLKSLFSEGFDHLAAEQSPQDPLPQLSSSQLRSYKVFKEIIHLNPSLLNHLCGEDTIVEDVMMVADLMQKGVNGARSDDVKGLKSAVIDWLVPSGQYLNPMIPRNSKEGRGFNHEVTGRLLCPADLNWDDSNIKAQLKSGVIVPAADQWPLLLYRDYTYDAKDPWHGLLRSDILVKAYKHIFTSPGSVDGKSNRATHSGNARIHGMESVTRASLAYVATLLRFSICSATVFSRSDTVTDSENFYITIMDLLEDPDEEDEVKNLLLFWNQTVFQFTTAKKRPSETSALAQIHKKRAALKAATTHNIPTTNATPGSHAGAS